MGGHGGNEETGKADVAPPPADVHADPARGTPRHLRQRLFAEVVGTFLRVLVDCGGGVIAALSPDVTPVARSMATGLLTMSVIYAIGNVSGAHFNPAVTVAFALRKVFPWRRVPSYIAAQTVGAFAGGAFLWAVFGNMGHLGATVPRFGEGRAFAMEVTLTLIVVLVTLGTATRHRSVGTEAAIATGGSVALCSLFARPISGASMNPVRSLAPAVLSHTWSGQWIYLVAPFVGAIAAFGLTRVLHSRRHPDENDVAEGVAD